MSKIILLVIVILAAGYLAVSHGCDALASDEDRIWTMLDAMADGFNAQHAGDAVGGLAPDFVDRKSGLGNREIHGLLVRFFIIESQGSGSRFRVELLRDRSTIAVDGDEAEASVVASFTSGRGGSSEEAALVRFDARIVRREGEWTVAETQRETLSGRFPF